MTMYMSNAATPLIPPPEPHPSAETVIIPFGTVARGLSLGELARTNRGYLEWLAGKKDFFDPYWPKAARLALDGEPVPPKEVRGKAPAAAAPAAAPAAASPAPSFTKIDAQTIGVTFPNDAQLRERFKELVEGRSWNQDARRWEFPAAQIVKAVQVFGGFDRVAFDHGAYVAYKAEIDRRGKLDEIRGQLDTDLELATVIPPFGYQRVGVEFWLRSGMRCMILDDVGLGKTFQYIAAATLVEGKCLVIAPAAVKLNWRKSIRRILGIDCPKCANPKAKLEHTCATLWYSDKIDGSLENKFHVINYEVFGKWKKTLVDMDFQFLGIDECHYLSNPKSQRTLQLFGGTEKKKDPKTKQVRRIRHDRYETPYCMLLSATLVNNHPSEFFSLLNYVAPDRFPDFWAYGMRYGAFRPGNLSGLPSTPQNLGELHERTKDIVLRRTEDDVKSDRPKAVEAELWVELSPARRKEYKRLLDDLMGEWAEQGKPTLPAMHVLREWLNQVKLELAWQKMDELVQAGKQVVLFSTRLDPLKATLARYGEQAVLIDGGMSLKRRQDSIEAMEEGQASACGISIRAGGTGIDGLQHRCHHMIFLDLDWVPSLHHQAKGRLDRTGQTMPVQIWYILVEDTVDEYLKEIIERKLAITSQITDGKVRTLKRKKSVFKEFVQKLKREYKKLEALEDADESEGAAEDSLIEEEV